MSSNQNSIELWIFWYYEILLLLRYTQHSYYYFTFKSVIAGLENELKNCIILLVRFENEFQNEVVKIPKIWNSA